MLSEIFKEYGDQITTAVEVLLFIVLVASLFFGGTIGNLILNISKDMC